MVDLKPCPKCGDAWVYCNFEDSPYISHMFRIDCKCHYALYNSVWCKNSRSAIKAWNTRMEVKDDDND